MNKITELKPIELSAINGGDGGKGCLAVTWAAVVFLAPYAVHYASVASQYYMDIKRFAAQTEANRGTDIKFYTVNSVSSKTTKLIKNSLSYLTGNKNRFGWLEDGRYLD